VLQVSPREERIVTFGCVNQQHLTNRQNGDQQRKRHLPPSGKSEPFITRRGTGKGLNGGEGTKPYNTRATITNWIRRNRRTGKDTTKYDGGYSRPRGSNLLGSNPDPEPRTDETNHCILKRRNQEAQGQRTRGLSRRTTQTMRMASPTHSVLQDGRMENGHDEEKILYATSLLRDDAGTWITPYAEERITPAWDNWAGFKAELQRRFGVIDAKGEARIQLKKMKQPNDRSRNSGTNSALWPAKLNGTTQLEEHCS